MKKKKDTVDGGGDIALRLPIASWLFGGAMLIGIIVLVVTHFSEVKHFGMLLQEAQPTWLLVAFAVQIGTYVSAGAIWKIVVADKKHLPLGVLARLSIEKQTIDQLIPTGGVMGNLFLVRTMQRYGIPSPLVIEAILVDGLGYYIAFAIVTAGTLAILEIEHVITPVIATLISIIFVMLVAIPLLILWLLSHRMWKPPHWILRWQTIKEALDAIALVSPKHIISPMLLWQTALLHCAIFLFDAATLWTMMQAIHTSISPFTAFCAVVIAMMAATVTFIPGGIGTFEAGCIATLTLMGTPVEAALTGTLLLRILTLWLPLFPGFVLARQDLHRQHSSEKSNT